MKIRIFGIFLMVVLVTPGIYPPNAHADATCVLFPNLIECQGDDPPPPPPPEEYSFELTGYVYHSFQENDGGITPTRVIVRNTNRDIIAEPQPQGNMFYFIETKTSASSNTYIFEVIWNEPFNNFHRRDEQTITINANQHLIRNFLVRTDTWSYSSTFDFEDPASDKYYPKITSRVKYISPYLANGVAHGSISVFVESSEVLGSNDRLTTTLRIASEYHSEYPPDVYLYDCDCPQENTLGFFVLKDIKIYAEVIDFKTNDKEYNNFRWDKTNDDNGASAQMLELNSVETPTYLKTIDNALSPISMGTSTLSLYFPQLSPFAFALSASSFLYSTALDQIYDHDYILNAADNEGTAMAHWQNVAMSPYMTFIRQINEVGDVVRQQMMHASTYNYGYWDTKDDYDYHYIKIWADFVFRDYRGDITMQTPPLWLYTFV